MRPFLATLCCAIAAITPLVSRADTLTIKGSGELITFSLPNPVNTDPEFYTSDNGLPPPNFSLFGDVSPKINGVAIDSDSEFLYFGIDAIVLTNIPCLTPFDPYNPCFFTVAFDDGSINGIGNPPPLFSGPNSDPVLNLGTYSGYSGSGFPPPGSPLTLTISADTSPVPEPSSIALFTVGLLFLALATRHRQHFR
ncbi:PEP-CTERM sorting domain-containing protein [Tunturiibacter lichenicola]|uniref:PEP-CTERM sorting domain-containing protein n=1 Tax=Tunturiibacter lichenicola TaxID=2051959 RepID=UPI003D9B7ADF